MLVPPNIHKYRDSSDCINRQTKSPTQLLTNTKNIDTLKDAGTAPGVFFDLKSFY